MNKVELESTVRDYLDFKSMRDEADKAMKAAEEKLKAELIERGLDVLEVGEYIVRYRVTTVTTFDKDRFIDDFGENAYAEYTKQSTRQYFKVK